MRLALFQMAFDGEPLAKGERFCREARNNGADVALFPEMWSIGYGLPEPGASTADLIDLAQDADGTFVSHFAALARELDMAIAVTFLQRWEPLPRNSVALIDRRGETVLVYAKVHTCDWDRESILTPGDTFPVATLDTGAGPVAVGAMICFDALFPESARVLMLGGAEVILVPNSSSMDAIRWAYLRVRAFENMAVVALANYAAPDDDGGSAVYHPMAWDGEDGLPIDTEIVRADAREQIVYADIDLNALRVWRATETQGDAYRKPAAYGALVRNDPRDPFRRDDARR